MRSRWRQRGVTALDGVFLLGCLVLLGVMASRTPEIVDYVQRKACYRNQELVEGFFYQVLREEKAEIYDVAVAYVVRSNVPDAPSRLVVLVQPREGHYWDHLVTRDLPEHILPKNASCPVHDGVAQAPQVIDYAFLWGRWRCLHNVTHN